MINCRIKHQQRVYTKGGHNTGIVGVPNTSVQCSLKSKAKAGKVKVVKAAKLKKPSIDITHISDVKELFRSM